MDKLAMEKIIRCTQQLKGLESVWATSWTGGLALKAIKNNGGNLSMTGEDVLRVFGIRDFEQFLRPRSPVVGYRVYKEDGEPVIEFEGEKSKVLSFLLVGAIDYHLYRLHEILKELDDRVTEH
jgi:hypothetical protein